MANRYTLKSGLASDPTVWSGGAVPGSGDRVLINTGHTVELDGTYTWGDDSTATVVINSVSTTASIFLRGTLKASRTASSTLTCRGDLLIALAGTLDYGTEVDPIPADVTAQMVLNYSTAMAHNKYYVSTSLTERWAGFRLWGADKNPRTTMSAAAAADTTITVANATGWRVGDFLVFGLLAGSTSTESVTWRAIAAISGNQITLGTSLGAISQAGRTVMNLTRNVRITSYQSNFYRSNVGVCVQGALPPEKAIEIGPCEIVATGNGLGLSRSAGLAFYFNSNSITTSILKRIYRPTVHTVVSITGSSWVSTAAGGWLIGCSNAQNYKYTITEPVLSNTTGIDAFILRAGTSVSIPDAHVLKAASVIRSEYSQGGVDCTFTRTYAEATGKPITGNGMGIVLDDCVFNGVDRFADGLSAFGSVDHNRCDMGGAFGVFANPGLNAANGGFSPAYFNDCTFPASAVVSRGSNLYIQKASTFFNLRNKNNDPTAQEIYRHGGKVLRDNATTHRGQSSLSLSPWYTGYAITHQSTLAVGANATVRIRGSARFNATYGSANSPTLTVSGMGITPVVYTCPAVADTWHAIDLELTNPNSYPGSFTLDFAGNSSANSESALCWFDGIVMPDFVTWVRHYGYTYNPTNPTRSVNSVTQLTEAQAAALTGLSFDVGTLTLSEPHSLREVYDWMQWYECSNRLDPILTSTDGISFALAANLTLNAALTGSGTLAMPAGTLVGSTSTVAITHSAGTLVSVSVSGVLVGSRVQIYNVTTGAELYNDEPSSASFSINAGWTSNQTLRVRVGYAIGVVAKLPIEMFGVLSSTGASFLVSQEDDLAYNALGIDGGACTEFTPDYPNLQIDLSDGDGVTSVQRLYAWSAWSQTSQLGLALMFRGVTAQDSANFVINVGVVNTHLDNVSGVPVILTGGYLARSDGTTVIAASSGSIQMDSGKAFIAAGGSSYPTPPSATEIAEAVLAAAQATPIHADTKRMNSATVAGTGAVGDPWRGD